MTTKSARSATALEESLLLKILGADPDEALLMKQIRSAEVVEMDEYGSIGIYPRGATHRSVMRKLPVEGVLTDSDGVPISILLFQRDGWLCEMQIYKVDGSPIQRQISANDMEVLVLKKSGSTP